jgi:hypothetical protein
MRVLVVACALALRLAPEKATVLSSANSSAKAPPLSKTPWGEKWSLPYRQPMPNMQNTQYSADFHIGDITMRGIFDTGSFELLVLSEKCEHCSKTPYDAEKSPTFQPNGTVVQHVFGSGPCLSMKGYEQVSVGPMSAEHMTFYEIVQHNIPVFEGASFSAIVGLGDGPNEEDKSLLQKFGVSEFSICLERASGAPGWITWGGELTPEQKEKKAIALPVLGEHHWAVHMTGFGIGPQAVTCQDGCGAILDSGTSLIAAPTPALMALSMVLPPIHEDCSNLDSLPDLVFMLNGHELSLPPEAYVLRLTGTLVEAQSVWDILYFRPKVMKLDQCMPAFMQIDRTTQFGPLWILGMPFFRFFHSSFHIDEEDREKRTVFLMGADEKCQITDLESEQMEGYEEPSEKGTHVPNMVALQKNNKTAEGAKEGKSAAGVRTVYRSRRTKQVPLQIDPSTLLRPLRMGDSEKGKAGDHITL